MKVLMTSVLGLSLLLAAGCGVNKEYVQQQVSESEARTTQQVGQLQSDLTSQQEQISRLETLSQELSEKADMAINKAAGFENYQILFDGVVNFDFDQYEINPTAEQTLLEACDRLEQNPGSVVTIAGHTDQTGSTKYNMMLGQMRAEATKLFLADRCGVAPYRSFVVSYGETKPASMPDERSAASANRRVQVQVWGVPQQQ